MGRAHQARQVESALCRQLVQRRPQVRGVLSAMHDSKNLAMATQGGRQVDPIGTDARLRPANVHPAKGRKELLDLQLGHNFHRPRVESFEAPGTERAAVQRRLRCRGEQQRRSVMSLELPKHIDDGRQERGGQGLDLVEDQDAIREVMQLPTL